MQLYITVSLSYYVIFCHHKSLVIVSWATLILWSREMRIVQTEWKLQKEYSAYKTICLQDFLEVFQG